MLFMEYPSIRGHQSPDYSKKAAWDLLHAYIDAHNQSLIDERPGDGVQAISILQSQCENMNFSDKRRYNRIFQQVVAINYIKIFHNAKALVISVVNSYTEYQLMHTFLDSFE